MTAGPAAPLQPTGAPGTSLASARRDRTDRLERHRTALLARRRCPACAEHRPARELLAGEPCPHCAAPNLASTMAADRRIELALAPARRRRLIGYLLVGGAAAIAGIVPLLATVTTVMAMIILRRTILRGATDWLSPKRRVTTKLFLRQWLVIAALLMLVIDEIATLLPIPGWPIRVGSAALSAALYVEVALVMLRGRIARDQRSAELDVWEWLLPLFATAGLIGAAVAAAAMFLGAYEVVTMTFAWLGSLTAGAP